MEKLAEYRPDEETIEGWLDKFESRLVCCNIVNCAKKRNWCQSLVGNVGRRIIKKLPSEATWEEIKGELIRYLGETDPKSYAWQYLRNYKGTGKGLGEIASDVLDKAQDATEDEDTQQKLALDAFIQSLPKKLAELIKRKNFKTLKAALEEARFLQRLEEEDAKTNTVLTTSVKEEKKAIGEEEIIKKCTEHMMNLGWKAPTNRPKKVTCWCCGKEGHVVRQCPVIKANMAKKGAPASEVRQALN